MRYQKPKKYTVNTKRPTAKEASKWISTDQEASEWINTNNKELTLKHYKFLKEEMHYDATLTENF